jgi:hypothetical protein
MLRTHSYVQTRVHCDICGPGSCSCRNRGQLLLARKRDVDAQKRDAELTQCVAHLSASTAAAEARAAAAETSAASATAALVPLQQLKADRTREVDAWAGILQKHQADVVQLKATVDEQRRELELLRQASGKGCTIS